MTFSKEITEVLERVLDEAVKMSRIDSKKRDSDPGKYGTYIERVEDGIYGVYAQTYDSSEGDTWEAWLISIKDGFKILKHQADDNRFLTDEYFEDRLKEVPYGMLK